MLVKTRRGWEIPESEATPEAIFHDRRALMKAAAAGSILAAAASLFGLAPGAYAADAAAADPTPGDQMAGLYPAARNSAYELDRPVTVESAVTSYNNFYEFGFDKDIVAPAQALPVRPWTVTVDGMVEKPITIDFDQLVRQMTLEERLYRHRCVEGWSMSVPWTGFPLKALVDYAKPLSSAKYLRMESFKNPAIAPGQRKFFYPWPYVEGLTMAEATNDLAFIVTGAYGKPVQKQNGAPLRLATPWKYGFKSTKSIVRFSFVDERPVSFWEKLQSSEYGFWANVNPDVPHPRWSQATERVLGTDERRPTLIWNGYGAFVAQLYEGKTAREYFM